MQKKFKLLFVCVVMLVQMAGIVCDLHSDSGHAEDSSGIHMDSTSESHHDDCVSQLPIVALMSVGSEMKADRVLQTDTFIVSFAYFSIVAMYTPPPLNWLPDPSVSSSLRSVSPILRV